MSLNEKHSEIRRLIDAFESEAGKFHPVTFTKFFIAQDGVGAERKFSTPNHAIMLWQFVGLMKDGEPPSGLDQDLATSDLQWGLRGAELSAFGIIEGEQTDLFVRMASRAGSIFDEQDSQHIKSRLSNDFAQRLQHVFGTQDVPIVVTNNSPLSIWLNYLLYYLSKVNPVRENYERIEPEPFTLSLLALERLLMSSKIEKSDRSKTNIENIHFRVALSFPGELRGNVSAIADELRTELDADQLFYDFDYQAQLARPNLDTLLQEIYRNRSDLLVVFIDNNYANKEWCGIEWRAIRDIIKTKNDKKVMFVRYGEANPQGVFSIDGYIDGSSTTPKEIAQLIGSRLKSIDG